MTFGQISPSFQASHFGYYFLFSPSFQPSHIGYYFVFSWLRFLHTESHWIWRFFNLANKIVTKKDSARITAWNIEPFLIPFFNHFTQPSPLPIVKLKTLLSVLRIQLPTWKIVLSLYWLAPLMMTLKSPPTYMFLQVP